MAYPKKTYIRLGQRVSLYEQEMLERTLPEVLKPANPTEAFISDLERELIVAAKRQQREQIQFWRGVYTVGAISGGLLSIVGGVFMWTILRQQRASDHGQLQTTFSPVNLAEA